MWQDPRGHSKRLRPSRMEASWTSLVSKTVRVFAFPVYSFRMQFFSLGKTTSSSSGTSSWSSSLGSVSKKPWQWYGHSKKIFPEWTRVRNWSVHHFPSLGEKKYLRSSKAMNLWRCYGELFAETSGACNLETEELPDGKYEGNSHRWTRKYRDEMKIVRNSTILARKVTKIDPCRSPHFSATQSLLTLSFSIIMKAEKEDE